LSRNLATPFRLGRKPKAKVATEMGIKMKENWINYSHGLAQTKQQVG
jgi:hypothetical protein